MPDSATNAALISGGAQLAGSAINAFATSNLNKKNRKFSEHMYQRQLEDNLRFWNLQNEYNTPSAQMKRFMEAGLNPNLIYGQTNDASSIPSANFSQPDTRVPEWGNAASAVPAAFERYYDLQMRQAQVSNLREQNLILKHEGALRGTQAAQAAFDLEYDMDLRQTNADYRRESLRKVRTDIGLSQNRDVRESIASASNYREALSRMQTAIEQRTTMKLARAKTRAEIDKVLAESMNVQKQFEILSSDAAIRKFDAQIAKTGARPSDALPYRLFMQFFGDYFKD